MAQPGPPLRCPTCGAHVPEPADLTVFSTPCPYCRTPIALPDREARRAAIERMNERAHQEREGKRSRNLSLVIFLGIAAFAVGMAVFIMLQVRSAIHSAGTPPAPIDSARAGLPTLTARVEERQKAGCKRVVMPAKAYQGKVTSTYGLVSATCFEALATTGAPGQTVTIRIFGPSGKELANGPPAGPDIRFNVCPKEPGEHRVEIQAVTLGIPFSAAAVECPKPSLDDPAINGKDRVSAIMKERYAKGCREVTMPPKTVSTDQDINGTFQTGSCLLFIAATGAKENRLSLDLSTPFGEKVKTPDAATELSFLYCPKVAGPHQGHVRSAEGAPFTMAAVTCPLSVAR